MRPSLLPPAALLAGLAACAGPAPTPAGTVPAAYGYAKPGPAVGDPDGYGAPAVPVDPYCREAIASAAGAAQTAAISGTAGDAARAARAEGFARRDC